MGLEAFASEFRSIVGFGTARGTDMGKNEKNTRGNVPERMGTFSSVTEGPSDRNESL